MLKRAIIFLSLVLICTDALAQKCGENGYKISVSGIYGYNSTDSGYGGASLSAFLPLTRTFSAGAYFDCVSAGRYAASVTLTPVFPLQAGEIFIDGTAHYRSLYSDRTAEFVSAASVGYRMQWFSVQFGMFSRTLIDMNRRQHDNCNYVSEPFNLLYRASFHVRPASSKWNAGGGFSNYTAYEYERMWQPYFFVDGYWRLSDSLSLKADVTVKPAGMFHLVASFYGIRSSLGLSYRF